MFNLDLREIPEEKIKLLDNKILNYIEELVNISGNIIVRDGSLSDIDTAKKDCIIINDMFEKIGLEKPWDESEDLVQDLKDWYFRLLNKEQYGGFLD